MKLKLLRFSRYLIFSDLGDKGLVAIKTSREVFELHNELLR